MAGAEKARGLEEKRFIQNLTEKTIPYNKTELSKVVGSNVEAEVQFDTFDGEALKYVESMGFNPVRAALRKIGHDNVGKDHLKQHVKKVVLINHDKVEDRKNVLKEGVLEVHAAWGKKSYPVEKDIQKTVESAQ